MDRSSRKQGGRKYAIKELPIKIFTSSSPTGSVLEIDVQGSVNFKNRPSSSSKEALALAKVAPLSLKKDSKETSRGMKVYANPFIESYYPVLRDPFSETITSELDQFSIKAINPSDKEKKFQKKGKSEQKKDKIIHPRISELVEKEITSDNDTNDPDSLSLTQVKENLKQEIIKNFTVKVEKEKQVKSISQNNGKPDEEQLHLHHHEHHHHYYFDPKRPPNQVDYGPPVPKRESFTPPGLFSVSSKKWIGEEEFPSTLFQNNTTENSSSPYLYNMNSEYPNGFIPDVNLYCSTGAIFMKNSKTKVTKYENSSKFFAQSFFTNEAGFLQAGRVKPSSSSDTLICERKSDLIATHNYSDTELQKYLNDSGNFSSTISAPSPDYFMMFKAPERNNTEKINPPKSSDKIMEKLKKLDCFLASKVVSDAKQTSNIAYIRREYMTTEGVQTMESMASGRHYQSSLQSKPVVLKEEKGVGTSSNSLCAQRVSSPFKAGSLLLITKEKDSTLQRKKASLKSWTEKLKQELREIKKELSLIEERHTRKCKRSSTAIFRKGLILGDQKCCFTRTCEDTVVTDQTVEAVNPEKNVVYCLMPKINLSGKSKEGESDNHILMGKTKPIVDKRRISKHYKVPK